MTEIVSLNNLREQQEDKMALEAVAEAAVVEQPTVGQGLTRNFPIGIFDEMVNFLKATYPVNGVPANVVACIEDLRGCKATCARVLVNMAEAIDLNGAPRHD